MKYRLVIYDNRLWKRDCGKIPAKDMRRIIERIRELEEQPLRPGVDMKNLRNYEVADYRLRVGKYRVLFNIDDERREVLLLRVLHRSKLY